MLGVPSLIVKLKELRRGSAKSNGELADVLNADIPFSSLNSTHVASIEACFVGQLLLGKA
jgi:hypothetical protein